MKSGINMSDRLKNHKKIAFICMEIIHQCTQEFINSIVQVIIKPPINVIRVVRNKKQKLLLQLLSNRMEGSS